MVQKENLASLFVGSALAALACERSRAPSAGRALQAWLSGGAARLRRLLRLGWRKHCELLRLERLAWRGGLSYPAEDPGQRVPWQLPERFCLLTARALPQHPLIDPRWLADLFAQQSGRLQPPAMEALTALLAPSGLPTRWHGLHTVHLPNLVANAPAQTPMGAAALPRIAVCLHLFYPELWPEIASQLAHLPAGWDLLVTVPDFACTPQLRDGLAHHPQARVFPVPNRGRDVLPWLRLLGAGAFDAYDWVCKLHSKKSSHTEGQRWRQQLIQELVGKPEEVQALLLAMAATPKLGLVGPARHLMHPGHARWGHQADRASAALNIALGLPPLPEGASEWPYFAGTMFWFRPGAVRLLAPHALGEADFAPEMGQLDGTEAHALERLITRAVQSSGFACAQWDGDARRLEAVHWAN